jgi:hypothetical protein
VVIAKNTPDTAHHIHDGVDVSGKNEWMATPDRKLTMTSVGLRFPAF